VVVSVGNALVKQGREMHALIPPRGSISAALQAELPRARVAAAGQHLPAADLEDLDQTLAADVLVCSDHEDATTAAMALMGSIEGLRPLDAGSLASAAAIEAFTAVLVTLNVRYKAHSSLRLTGLEHP
ncbi:MAG TPA: NADPH-dependent F420 reductase, partial [Acidimicrobiales bacterium]|nr:NADPH-dependent F420 reductase [Acidimicrobiales bacterium]